MIKESLQASDWWMMDRLVDSCRDVMRRKEAEPGRGLTDSDLFLIRHGLNDLILRGLSPMRAHFGMD